MAPTSWQQSSATRRATRRPMSDAGGEEAIGSDPSVEVALDNDVILKAVCFGLAERLWPPGTALGVLGAAPFVLAKAATRSNVAASAGTVQRALSEFFKRPEVVEPTAAEAKLASELEYLAQREGLALDT